MTIRTARILLLVASLLLFGCSQSGGRSSTPSSSDADEIDYRLALDELNRIADRENAASKAVDDILKATDPFSLLNAISKAGEAWRTVPAQKDDFYDAQRQALSSLDPAIKAIADASERWVKALARFRHFVARGALDVELVP